MTVKTVAIFRNLPAGALAELARGSMILDCADRTMIFQKGDAADHVYAVVGGPGRVRIGSGDDSGKNLMVEVVGVGELFGELGILNHGVRTADALTEGPLRLLRVSAPVFMQVLHTAPGLGAALAQALAARLRRTYSLLEDATFESVEQRLARQILYLGDKHGRLVPGGVRLNGRYRQGDLADLLGVTTRSVITVLNGWRQIGIVEYDTSSGHITVLDRAKLLVAARRRFA
ncbi:MAG: Crp/Fnr family transcriptional regulator [Proteobacteria bacterium]|nr:Crp/Fnr family transcriptional regulator [Pseudomonadota bacterium]